MKPDSPEGVAVKAGSAGHSVRYYHSANAALPIIMASTWKRGGASVGESLWDLISRRRPLTAAERGYLGRRGCSFCGWFSALLWSNVQFESLSGQRLCHV